jgi:hypothetical protein
MKTIWWRVSRFFGWLWLPIPWLWRGCFDAAAAQECCRQAWIDLTTGRPGILENKVFSRDKHDGF